MDAISLAEEADELYRRGEFEDAVLFYDRAMERDSENKELYNRRGLALCRMDRHQDAIDSFDAALKIDQQYTDALNNKGVVFYKQKRYDEAMAFFDQIIERDPKYVRACTTGELSWTGWDDSGRRSYAMTRPSI